MWSPEAWRLGFAADRLYLAPAAPSRGGECREIVFTAGSSGRPWPAAMAALEAEFAGAGRQPPRAIHVVLGGCHAHWRLLEIPAAVDTPAERQAFAAYHFRLSLGEHVADWRFFVGEQPAGWPSPACAVDAALVAAIVAWCERSGVRLLSLAPYFSTAFDHWRGRLVGDPFWFCVAEPGLLSLGLVAGGRWLGLQARGLAGDVASLAAVPEQLAAMQAQLALPAGIAVEAPRLHCAGIAATGLSVAADPIELAPPPGWPAAAVRARLAYGL